MGMTFLRKTGAGPPPPLKYRTARQLTEAKIFPISEEALRRHAKKNGIGKKAGRHILVVSPVVV